MSSRIAMHESHFYFMSDFVYDILPRPNFLIENGILLTDLISVLIESTIVIDASPRNALHQPTQLIDVIHRDGKSYQYAIDTAFDIIERSRRAGLFDLFGDKMYHFTKQLAKYRSFSVQCNLVGEYYIIRLKRSER